MNYYDEEQFLAQVDENDKFLGRVEKWEAHTSGLLHRAFTIALTINGDILLQHRKHPVFDGVYDLTCSSHPMCNQDSEEGVQGLADAGGAALEREWGLQQSELLSSLKDIGSVYYQAKDPHSKYVEHEICHLLIGEVERVPEPNPEFAYGYSILEAQSLVNNWEKKPIAASAAPWVEPLIALMQRHLQE